MLTFISKTVSSFVIYSNHIVQAYQIYDYSIKHENTSKITITINELIKYIILTYLNNTYEISFKNIDKSKSMKFLFYFENWVFIKLIRQETFRKFRE